MNEQISELPEQKTYQELIDGATSHDEVIAAREMALADLAKAATTASSDERTFDVTTMGKDKFAELNESPEKIEKSAAISSESWHNEKK